MAVNINNYYHAEEIDETNCAIMIIGPGGKLWKHK